MNKTNETNTASGNAPKITFDPYQPAKLIAEALGYAIYRQSGLCWIYNKFTKASAPCPQPDPWKSAQYLFETYSSLVA